MNSKRYSDQELFHSSLAQRVATVSGLIAPCFSSWWKGKADEKSFEEVQAFCLFIGYPRSGHSLVGALLDAHPEIVIANELDVLKHVHLRFSRRQIFHLLLERSKQFERQGSVGGNYEYPVPGQWQGRFQRVRIIGDKKGGGTALRLRAWPFLLDRLQNVTGLPIKIIHVMRHPLDNIATIARRQNWPLERSAEYYFGICESVAAVKERIGGERNPGTEVRFSILDLRHEDFIDDPQRELKSLCDFLGIAAKPEYLTACAHLVYKTPHRSRTKASWPPELIAAVAARAKRFSFLDSYDCASL